MGLFESTGSWILALGKTLVHSLWAGLFVYAAVRLLLQWISQDRPVIRYRVAFVSQLLFAAGMILAFLALYNPVTGGGAREVQIRLPYPVRIIDESGPGRISILYYYSSLLYFTGITFSVIFTLKGLLRIRRVRKRAQAVEGTWKEHFAELCLRAGIRKNVALLSSARAMSPFLTGLLKPVVIVPAGIFTQLPFAQVEFILLHELYHLKRRDHLAVILQRILSILFFYHPGVRALASIAEREREHCCDDYVLDQRREPVEYARALCLLADRMKGSVFAPVSPATGKCRRHFKYRIQRILNQEPMRTNMKERFSAIALFALALAVVLLMSGFSAGLSITRYNQHPDTLALNSDDNKKSDEPALSDVPVDSPAPASAATPAAEPEERAPALPEAYPLPDLAAYPHPGTLPCPDSAMPDMEALKKYMEEARKAVDEIDWDAIHKEIEQARAKAMDEINWDSIHHEIEKARKKAMDEIDWEAIHKQMEEARESLKDIDWEEMHKEMSKAWEEIDWEEMQKALEGIHLDLDSLMQNLHFEHNFDFDFDFDSHPDHEAEVENDLDI
jgi:bla regulator protein BlaR1